LNHQDNTLLFTFFILTLFDKRLVPGYKIVNKYENAISAKIFDALSNINTVIPKTTVVMLLRFDRDMFFPFVYFIHISILNHSGIV